MAKKDKDYKGPYHIVNQTTGKHLGAFTTEIDCLLARTLSNEFSWRTATIMDKATFAEHLASLSSSR